jgi:hypothetical protein
MHLERELLQREYCKLHSLLHPRRRRRIESKKKKTRRRIKSKNKKNEKTKYVL